LTYGTTYGVKRTTIYLPEDMKARLEQEAARRSITEAELIRQAVDEELRGTELRGGLFTADAGPHGADLARDKRGTWLEGFGES
jgi:predicted transcriptional regulator